MPRPDVGDGCAASGLAPFDTGRSVFGLSAGPGRGPVGKKRVRIVGASFTAKQDGFGVTATHNLEEESTTAYFSAREGLRQYLFDVNPVIGASGFDHEWLAGERRGPGSCDGKPE